VRVGLRIVGRSGKDGLPGLFGFGVFACALKRGCLLGLG
jgi:hypothetical protein